MSPLSLKAVPRHLSARLEERVEADGEQVGLWLPVALGLGAALWFGLPRVEHWIALIAAAAGAGLVAWRLSERRWVRAVAWGALALAAGLALAWARGIWVSHPVLERPVVVHAVVRVDAVEDRPAEGKRRAVVQLLRVRGGVPPVERARLSFPAAGSHDVRVGAVLDLRVRLMPPPGAALPGAYDFARTAWFGRLGATGTPLGSVAVLKPGRADAGVRSRLAMHIRGRVPGGAGAIAATLATGDRAAIPEADADAMRRSGLAHLLSISGLHVTAVVGATVLLAGALLGAWPWLALRIVVPVWAAGAGAAAGVGYTLLTGAQVPTVRACVAALIVLAGLMLGRQAITLRLVATGALFVLLLWPESVVGPSFQLSFAAVTVIVALHRTEWMRRWTGRRPDEALWRRAARAALSLALTGLAVEAALMPIALAHFHRSGLLGAAANMVAIPLTTFMIMPAEALALALEPTGSAGPIWRVVGWSLEQLLRVAHAVASTPGSQLLVGEVPDGAIALIVGGGLWVCLWRTRWRRWGAVPVMVGSVWIVATPPPDLMVTADGRQIGMRQADGSLALLRGDGGTFVADQIGEAAGIDTSPVPLEDAPGARCRSDACWIHVARHHRSLLVLATRSRDLLEPRAFRLACARADIVVSDRRLPAWCRPKGMRLDRQALEAVGGVTLALRPRTLRTGRSASDDHPWRLRHDHKLGLRGRPAARRRHD